QRASADDKRPKCKAQLSAKSAHAEKILLVHSVNHDTRSKEEKRFEECVCHEVKHGGGPRAESKCEEHVADLADGGICQHALHIALSERTEGGEQHRCGSDDGNSKLN